MNFRQFPESQVVELPERDQNPGTVVADPEAALAAGTFRGQNANPNSRTQSATAADALDSSAEDLGEPRILETADNVPDLERPTTGGNGRVSAAAAPDTPRPQFKKDVDDERLSTGDRDRTDRAVGTRATVNLVDIADTDQPAVGSVQPGDIKPGGTESAADEGQAGAITAERTPAELEDRIGDDHETQSKHQSETDTGEPLKESHRPDNIPATDGEGGDGGSPENPEGDSDAPEPYVRRAAELSKLVKDVFTGEELDATDAFRQLEQEGLHAAGKNMFVFKYEQLGQKPLAIKIPRPGDSEATVAAVRQRRDAMENVVLQSSGFENIVDCLDDPPALITGFIEGKSIGKLSPEELDAIDPLEYDVFTKYLLALQITHRRLPKSPDDFIRTSGQAFTMLIHETEKPGGEQSLAEKVDAFENLLQLRPDAEAEDQHEDSEEQPLPRRAISLLRACMGSLESQAPGLTGSLLNRWRQLGYRFPEESDEPADDGADKDILSKLPEIPDTVVDGTIPIEELLKRGTINVGGNRGFLISGNTDLGAATITTNLRGPDGFTRTEVWNHSITQNVVANKLLINTQSVQHFMNATGISHLEIGFSNPGDHNPIAPGMGMQISRIRTPEGVRVKVNLNREVQSRMVSDATRAERMLGSLNEKSLLVEWVTRLNLTMHDVYMALRRAKWDTSMSEFEVLETAILDTASESWKGFFRDMMIPSNRRIFVRPTETKPASNKNQNDESEKRNQ